jgi:hypothetical protein
MNMRSYAEAILAKTQALRTTPGWDQWFVALDGTRTPISITQELNALRGDAVAASLETSVVMRHASQRITAPGLIWLTRDGAVEMGDELIGHWEA